MLLFFLSVCLGSPVLAYIGFLISFFQQIFMRAVNMSHALELNTGNIEINKKIGFPFLKELSLFGNGHHTNKSA